MQERLRFFLVDPSGATVTCNVTKLHRPQSTSPQYPAETALALNSVKQGEGAKHEVTCQAVARQTVMPKPPRSLSFPLG